MLTVKTKDELKALGNLILLDFWAPWCAPCQKMSPVFEEVSLLPQFKHIVFGKVNIDESEELAIDFNVPAIPYLVALKDKEVCWTHSGGLSAKSLSAYIVAQLGSAQI